MTHPSFNSEKFRELLLYVAHHSVRDPWFGAVKLNKILFYCDFIAFKRFLNPITGASYVKLPEGPAPRELLSERSALLDEGLADMEYRRVFRYMQQRLVATGDHEHLSNRFGDGERRVVEEVLEALRPLNGSEASELSHSEIGWILADDNTVIPYESALLMNPDDLDFWAWDENESTS